MNFVVWKGVREPVSAQIARQLADAIRAGEFKPGEKLPSIRKLKKELGVAFNTVLRAYKDLADMGLSYSIRGRGVYVSDDAPAPIPPRPPADERKHFLHLADALIAQAERCGYGIVDALSEVRMRERMKRAKAEAEEGERRMRRDPPAGGERRGEAEAAEREEREKRLLGEPLDELPDRS